MNYRSVVIRGLADLVTDPAEKDIALAAIVEHASPGRNSTSRPPNDRELAATTVIRVPLESVSAKVRSGGSHDDPQDEGLGFWCGVIPLRLVAGDPEPDEGSAEGAKPPAADPRFRA
jgi:hypothetical protein